MSNQDKLIAATILRQLGGNRFIAMTGANSFVCDKNMMGCRIGKNASGANYMRIKLNAKDLYDIEFIAIRGASVKTKAESNDVYCDMLQSEFTRLTGMYTSL